MYGDRQLLEKVFRIKPKLHLFGHTHETPGTECLEGITFSNVSGNRYHYFMFNSSIMSEKNSSLTRVAPLGEAILKNHHLVEALLQLLPRNPNITFGEFSDKDVFFSASPRKEKSLPPTKEHLTLIIEKIEHDEAFRNSIKELAIQSSSKENQVNRILLFDLKPQTLAEAKRKLVNLILIILEMIAGIYLKVNLTPIYLLRMRISYFLLKAREQNLLPQKK